MTETILITGGTGKFGRQFVKAFERKGWFVVFTTTDQSRATELIQSEGLSNTKGIEIDLMGEDSTESLVEELQKLDIEVNHLVNNARSLSSLKINDAGRTERKDFQAEYLMDVIVPYELSMELVRVQSLQLKTITNIGSQYGLVAANPHLYRDYLKQSPIQYGVAKAALNHLTKELAVRFAKANIRVNCIAYGGVEGRVDDEFKNRYSKLTPSEKMLAEQDIVGPLESILNDGNSAITGHTLVADGGWSLW